MLYGKASMNSKIWVDLTEWTCLHGKFQSVIRNVTYPSQIINLKVNKRQHYHVVGLRGSTEVADLGVTGWVPKRTLLSTGENFLAFL